MPPPAVPGAVVVAFDDAAADAFCRSLADLADRLVVVSRADAELLPATCADWRGFSRTWFDRRHTEVAGALAAARTAVLQTIAAVVAAQADAAARQEQANAQALADQAAAAAAAQAAAATAGSHP